MRRCRSMCRPSWGPSGVWADRAVRVVAGLALAAVVSAAPSRALTAGDERPVSGVSIAPEALWEAVFAEEAPLVVDVREAQKFARSRIPRSRNLRTPDAIAGVTMEDGRPLVLVGDTEEQARALAAQVKASGRAVRVLRGGLRKWTFGLEMNAEELRRRLQGKEPPQFVDVRTTVEYQSCRIEGAVHRPLDQIETWGPTVSRNDEVVLVCRTSRRSGLAQEWLARHGVRHVHNLLGGTAGWPYGWVGEQCPP